MRDVLLVLLGIVGAAGVNLLTSLADKEAVHRWRWPLTAVVLLAFVLPVFWKHRLGSANAPVRKLCRVAAVDNGEGGMDVLAVTKNGKVITATCTGKSLWSPWRVILETGFAWDVAAVVPRQGIVEYYALDRDGTIRMRTRDRGHLSTWQVVRILGDTHGRAMCVASSSLAPGHRELMVITDSGRLLHAWRTDGQGWSQWHDSGLAGARDVTVCAPHDGLFENFAVDADGEVWHRWFWERWTEWERWGRPGSPARAVSAFRKLTEYQELFVVGDAGDLGHRHHQRGHAWSDWLVMDTPAGVIDVAGSTTSPNSLRCLIVDSEGALWLRPYDGTGNRWLDWCRVSIG
ncbi:hypothetical protein AB0I91_34905 [Actinosynnema sp. NPDC049800]